MDSSDTVRSLLENTFFRDAEQMVVQRLHAEAMTPEAQAELIRTTGAHDPELIEELVKLGVTGQGIMAMRLVPLVLVAWSDHHVDLEERRRILAIAEDLGIREESVSGLLLDFWLRKLPPQEIVDAWRRYIRGILHRITNKAREKLISATQGQMLAVARASGGHLGFGRISDKEQQMINGLVKFMRDDSH